MDNAALVLEDCQPLGGRIRRSIVDDNNRPIILACQGEKLPQGLLDSFFFIVHRNDDTQLPFHSHPIQAIWLRDKRLLSLIVESRWPLGEKKPENRADHT